MDRARTIDLGIKRLGFILQWIIIRPGFKSHMAKWPDSFEVIHCNNLEYKTQNMLSKKLCPDLINKPVLWWKKQIITLRSEVRSKFEGYPLADINSG